MDKSRYRLEQDLLGQIQLPCGVNYGVQTERAVHNFPGDRQLSIGQYPSVITGLLQIKQAAAIANQRAGYLSNSRKEAICIVAQEILDNHQFSDFPVHRLHGGGGTSANMNANEVIANIGNNYLERNQEETRLDPNDHVNLHQSTNDVYPSACRMAIISEGEKLNATLAQLHGALVAKAEALGGINRLARTCLRDAVPITYGDLFSGYGALISRRKKKLKDDINDLYSLNLGGTIVGDSSCVPKSYFDNIIPALCEITGDNGYFMSKNLFDSAQNPDETIAVAVSLDLTARSLIKIAKDIRLLSSGPEAGLNEIEIPAVQPGSSAMPGKINPVIPEFVMQSCMQIIGNCHAATMAIDFGELDLNIWESIIVFNILDSMDLLENAISVFIEKCIDGLQVNLEVNKQHCRTTIAIVSTLVQKQGYNRINKICKKAIANKKEIKTLLKEENLIPEDF